MCGRFVSPGEADLERLFHLRVGHPFQRVYNAAPSMLLPVIRLVDGGLVATPMQWGLIPSWWSKEELPTHTINARIEDAAEKPMWRGAVRHTRCIVPALGYYEWQAAAGKGPKQPYFIHAPDDTLLCFAGLWSEWRGTLTFAILTTGAAASVADVHDRMPVALTDYSRWLDPTQKDGAALTAWAASQARGELVHYKVSTKVNSPKNQGEELLQAVS